MQGEYIAIEKTTCVGRGIYDEEFEIVDVHATVRYAQKELMRHRMKIEGQKVAFLQANSITRWSRASNGSFFFDFIISLL